MYPPQQCDRVIASHHANGALPQNALKNCLWRDAARRDSRFLAGSGASRESDTGADLLTETRPVLVRATGIRACLLIVALSPSSADATGLNPCRQARAAAEEVASPRAQLRLRTRSRDSAVRSSCLAPSLPNVACFKAANSGSATAAANASSMRCRAVGPMWAARAPQMSCSPSRSLRLWTRTSWRRTASISGSWPHGPSP